MGENFKKRGPSDVAFFRDQKSGRHPSGEYPTVSPIDRTHWEMEEKKKRQQSKDIRKKIENPEDQSEVSGLKGALDKINRAELEDSFKDDEVQKQLLEKRKQEAKKLIKEVIEKAVEYVDKVEVNVTAQQADVSGKIKKQMIEASDINRSRAHNALLSSLYSAIRNISHNFGNISEAAIEKWTEFLEDHEQELLMVKRQDFPVNVICPDGIDIKNRDSVGEWAGNIKKALSQLPPELLH